MDAAKLREMEISELQKKLAEFREELFKLRFQHSIGQLKNTARIPSVKRTIARILTIMREKQLELKDGRTKESN
ncbi:50S ribosomal protein L29 [Desulfothermus okinawensis JCM 13304]